MNRITTAVAVMLILSVVGAFAYDRAEIILWAGCGIALFLAMAELVLEYLHCRYQRRFPRNLRISRRAAYRHYVRRAR